ncbi:hypothetical protein NQ315_014025 [Exocentrus adspersus]|uniref:Peptidase M12B domain-containing protein n=1 Tax=Exocentrus adspersus TaxID=1586481 RepID=A0AAV8VCJ5_9CUCU|nr:hypothetical protein NQ315_014025 [Exocentrus adspersus]
MSFRNHVILERDFYGTRTFVVFEESPFKESDGNCSLAARIYAQKYPKRSHPDVRSLQNVNEQFERTGSVSYEEKQDTDCLLKKENQLAMSLAVVENPQVGVRVLSNDLDIKKSSISKCLPKNKFHPYHVQLHQELLENDFERRIYFCQWVHNVVAENENFFKFVFFTDECTFHRNGFVNRHNFHYYDTQNPHIVQVNNHQHNWSINVWGGILHNYVIGPYIFQVSVTGEVFLNFLRNDFPRLTQHVPDFIKNLRSPIREKRDPIITTYTTQRILRQHFRGDEEDDTEQAFFEDGLSTVEQEQGMNVTGGNSYAVNDSEQFLDPQLYNQEENGYFYDTAWTADTIQTRHRGGSILPSRWMEIAIAVDHTLISFHGRNKVEQYVLALMNIVSAIYQDSSLEANMKLVVTRLYMYEHKKHNVVRPGNAKKSLENVNAWNRRLHMSLAPGEHHDLAIWLTRSDIGGPSGYAPVAGVCDPKRSCALNRDEGLTSAFIIAHETAHM